MATDLLTVLWKEWKDLFGRFGVSRPSLQLRMVLLLGWFGMPC